MTRSSRLLTVGVLVIALGLIVAFFALRSESDPIQVNPAASEGAGDGVSASENPSELASERGIGELAEDASRMPSPLVIPEGFEAIAVSAAYANGVAAIPAPGDLVNVYGIFTDGLPAELQQLQDDLKRAADPFGTDEDAQASPATQQDDNGVVRLLQRVEVLGVSGVLAESGGGAVTLVLAVSPADAERLIYQVATQQVWFTLVNPDDEPVDGEGVVHDNILSEAIS